MQCMSTVPGATSDSSSWIAPFCRIHWWRAHCSGIAGGAFTGAVSSREGLIRQAHGGTLFLDEIGELPLKMQKAFLRVLQEKRFRAVGSGEEIASDFRLVAATNRDLDHMAADGGFRKDLLFRIKALHMHLPPLRERPEDIKPLSMYHLTKACDRRQIGTKGVAPDFIEALMRYPWPGNVRELVNTKDVLFKGYFPVFRNTSCMQHIVHPSRLHAIPPDISNILKIYGKQKYKFSLSSWYGC